MFQTHPGRHDAGRIAGVVVGSVATAAQHGIQFGQTGAQMHGPELVRVLLSAAVDKLVSQRDGHPLELGAHEFRHVLAQRREPHERVGGLQHFALPVLVEQQDEFEDASGAVGGQEDVAVAAQHGHDLFRQVAFGLLDLHGRQLQGLELSKGGPARSRDEHVGCRGVLQERGGIQVPFLGHVVLFGNDDESFVLSALQAVKSAAHDVSSSVRLHREYVLYVNGLGILDGVNRRKNIINVLQSEGRSSSVHANGSVLIVQCHLSHFDSRKRGVNGRWDVRPGWIGSGCHCHLLSVIHGQSTQRLQLTVRQQDTVVRWELELLLLGWFFLLLLHAPHRRHEPSHIHEAATTRVFEQRAAGIFRLSLGTEPTAVHWSHAQHRRHYVRSVFVTVLATAVQQCV